LFIGGSSLALAALAYSSMANAQEASALEEVIVTATRTDQALSRVPVSVAAFTQEAMDSRGIRSVDDLTRITPGVNFSRGTYGLQTNISIRGISSTAGTATTGIYIDDTPIQVRTIGNSSGNTYPAVFDLERVEILRGPQGTLFGAGSQGGTVRFISPEPSLTDYSVYSRAELAFTKGGAPSYEFGAAAGGPIVENVLGFRASAYYRRDGGFVDRVAYPTGYNNCQDCNWIDTKVMRVAATWAAADNLRITPSVFYQDLYSNNSPVYWQRVAGRVLSDPKDGDYVSGARNNSTNNDWFVLPAIKAQWDLGGVTLDSNTSYFFRKEKGIYDYTAFYPNTFGGTRDPTPILATPGYYDLGTLGNKQNSWVQEVRISRNNPDERINWVGGVFYSSSIQTANQELQSPYIALVLPVPPAIFFAGAPMLPNGIIYVDGFRTKDTQVALFGEANFKVTEQLTLTAGLRYSKNELRYYTYRDGPAQGGAGSNSGDQEGSPLTPRFTASFQIDDANMVYATASKGFRLGGVNRAIPTAAASCRAGLNSLGYDSAPTTFNSDTLWSYEVGTKNRFADGRVRVAASAYQIDWKDIIRSVNVQGCGFAFFANLGEARSRGFDLQADFAPADGLTLSALVGYNNVEYVKSIRIAGATSDLVTKGHTLGGAPWSVALSANYEFVGPRGTDSYVRADFDYRRRNDGLTPTFDPANASYDALAVRDPSTTNLRLRAGLKVRNADMSVFVNNALNSTPVLGLGHGSRTGQIWTGNPVRPITAGVTVTYRQ
jgi:outer membrane receptor protein involved in Fe transport